MRKLLACLGLFLQLAPIAASAQESPGVAAEWALEQGILFPRLDGEFMAEGAVTRLEFTLATIDHLYSSEDMVNCFRNIAPSHPVKYRKLFGDVERESWYGKQMCMAIYMGLVNGDRDGNFRPFEYITVGEASKILARGYGLIYPAPNPTGMPWYHAPMLALEMQGAVTSRMRAGSELTRDQMATMFYALRNQERYPLSRIIGARSAPVASATTDVPALPAEPVSGFAPSARIVRGETCACLPPAESPASLSVKQNAPLPSEPAAVAAPRPPRTSHRLLRKQVLESRARARAVPAQP